MVFPSIRRRTSVRHRLFDLEGEDCRKAPILSQSQSDDPISRYRKPVERSNEIAYHLIPLVRSASFPLQLIGSCDWSPKVDGGLK